MTEMELVRLAQRGDDDAFAQLVHLHEKKVYALCLRMCRSEEDAYDALQDTFLAAWRALPQFRQDAQFSTWLYRLASNACIDLLRREKRHRSEVSLDDEPVGAELCDERTPLPQEQLEEAELCDAVRDGLAALSDEHREVLLLRENAQLSYQEISEALSLDVNTVKTRIHRARKSLRAFLAENGTFSDAAPSKKADKQRSIEKEAEYDAIL